MTQTVTVDLPSDVYVRLKKRADQAHRSVEDETLELLTACVPPDDWQQTVASLELLDDAALERAARTRLAAELSAELETLHHKQQREGLTEVESHRSAELVRAYERSMLVRAHAAALLKKRGIAVPSPVA